MDRRGVSRRVSESVGDVFLVSVDFRKLILNVE